MGRQPFLTRLAFGRSPFEPSASATRSSEYVQLDSSQQDTPLEARAPNSNRYIQLFDERGDPVNPRAHQYGRQFRRAQNDVLSSIGFLARRRSLSEDFPGTYEERVIRLKDEDSVGNTINRISTITATICTWWIGSLRDRILTFHIEDALPFSQIIASEHRTSGAPFFYTGMAADDISAIATHTAANVIDILRPMDRLLLATRATPKTKSVVRQWRNATRTIGIVCLDVLFFPLVYHSRAQRLGLYPETPLFPRWGALVPFSSASPLPGLFPDSRLSMSNPLQILTAIITSPVFLFCLETIVKRWITNMVHDAIETSITCPDKSDMSYYGAARRRSRFALGSQPTSPLFVRRFINKIMGILGWGGSTSVQEGKEQQLSEERRTEVQEMIGVSDGRAVNSSRRAVSTRTHAGQEGEMQIPDSPTVSQASEDGNDPRIRITARGGVVEMEVQLPPHVMSSHAEVVDASASTGENAPWSFPRKDVEAYHRVTQLSAGPAQRLSAVVERHVVGWVVLPLRLLALRSMAAHVQQDTRRPMFALDGLSLVPSTFPTAWNVRSFGMLASRLALCGACELATDLGVWGLQWMAATWTGKNVYGWGTL